MKLLNIQSHKEIPAAIGTACYMAFMLVAMAAMAIYEVGRGVKRLFHPR